MTVSNDVLFLSYNGDNCSFISERLRLSDIALHEVHSIPHAQQELLTRKYQVFVHRCDTINNSLYELLQFIIKQNLSLQIIFSSKVGGVEDAVRLMKAGASDFIVSDASDTRLVDSILRNIAKRNRKATSVDNDDNSQSGEIETILVGQSPAICEIRSAINLVAKSQTTVLITGESGTGKEVVARLIHQRSDRGEKPFIAVNCAALPKDVIENELFGHEKGAFTGALIKKAGCFEQAHLGTLFFDEIAEMTPEIQAKLLRALELQAFRRLGGKEEITVDVRTVAATNKNITAALKSHQLREDLYYRLSVIEIFIPPLRERKEDILLLIEHFLSIYSEKYGKNRQHFNDETSEMLISYGWPGNARELRNVVERSVIICPDEQIDVHYLSNRILAQQSVRSHVRIPVGSSSEEAQRMLILQTLESVGNNKSKAAKILGLSRKTLHNKLSKFAQD